MVDRVKGKPELKSWTLRADSVHGIYIDCPDELFKAIIAPPQLDSTLNVGWQHRHYASCHDPKEDIAEEMMSILKRSAVAGILTKEEDTESWRRDLSDNYGQAEEEFTPHSGSYRTGQGDRVYCMQGEAEDFTACDKECGYCGRCQY